MLPLPNHFYYCGLLLRLAGRCVWQPQTRAQQFGSLPQGEGDEGKQCDNVGAGLRDVDKRFEGKRVRRTSFCNHSPSSMRVQASGCAPSSGCFRVGSPERRRRRNGKHLRRFARLPARGISWSLLFSHVIPVYDGGSGMEAAILSPTSKVGFSRRLSVCDASPAARPWYLPGTQTGDVTPNLCTTNAFAERSCARGVRRENVLAKSPDGLFTIESLRSAHAREGYDEGGICRGKARVDEGHLSFFDWSSEFSQASSLPI